MSKVSIDLIQGITEFTSRNSLKQLFTQFGEVASCWVPPAGFRGKEVAYVKFVTTYAAEQALNAANSGQLFLDGVTVKAAWRDEKNRSTFDSRDFDAKGSNLITSRDMFRDLQANRKGSRSRSRDRKKRSRSKDKKDKGKKDKKSKKDKKKKSSSSSSDSGPDLVEVSASGLKPRAVVARGTFRAGETVSLD
eukprot:gnl/TRDRNA2_/TRDRNA2_80449_c0_seq1.p1 gnl/TRDRNA2_/TRDRNA2_80449_c0~~gnl/TRDRNA2_/TRDRNA2_80449_c0_seq1.p1  ORF type:complete len:192 (-),score=42.45 gnl/TRDRNA2_/TRDRNA2_80449_c0_seq1:42-617(-)